MSTPSNESAVSITNVFLVSSTTGNLNPSLYGFLVFVTTSSRTKFPTNKPRVDFVCSWTRVSFSRSNFTTLSLKNVDAILSSLYESRFCSRRILKYKSSPKRPGISMYRTANFPLASSNVFFSVFTLCLLVSSPHCLD